MHTVKVKYTLPGFQIATMPACNTITSKTRVPPRLQHTNECKCKYDLHLISKQELDLITTQPTITETCRQMYAALIVLQLSDIPDYSCTSLKSLHRQNHVSALLIVPCKRIPAGANCKLIIIIIILLL